MEIVVDAHDQEEQAMGRYDNLDDMLTLPFIARCRARRAISPLQEGDDGDVIAMAPQSECEHEMFVMIRWEKEGLGVPLSQLVVTHADEQTRQEVEGGITGSGGATSSEVCGRKEETDASAQS